MSASARLSVLLTIAAVTIGAAAACDSRPAAVPSRKVADQLTVASPMVLADSVASVPMAEARVRLAPKGVVGGVAGQPVELRAGQGDADGAEGAEAPAQ
jgi:hypothetical protein